MPKKGRSLMNQEWELHFLCDVLEKCHIPTAVRSPLDEAEAIMDPRLCSIVKARSGLTVQKMIGQIESQTKYILSDGFRLQYICIPLSVLSENNLLFIRFSFRNDSLSRAATAVY